MDAINSGKYGCCLIMSIYFNYQIHIIFSIQTQATERDYMADGSASIRKGENLIIVLVLFFLVHYTDFFFNYIRREHTLNHY